MQYKQKNKLQRISGLMLLSVLMLAGFLGYWLYNQFVNEHAAFEKAVTMEFEASQRKISDSVIFVKVVNPMLRSAKISSDVKIKVEINNEDTIKSGSWKMKTIMASEFPGHKDIVKVYSKPDTTSFFSDSILPGDETRVLSMLVEKLKLVADSVNNPRSEKDTVLFNKAFAGTMRENGWNFNIRWVKDNKSKVGNKQFYVKSGYLTQSYNIEVSHFTWQIVKKVMPQVLFSLTLLLLTILAFRVAYVSLKRHMELSIMKDDFISNMSHELKTPIATVKVALEALSKFNVLEDRQKSIEYLDMAGLEINRLDMLVHQALQASLIEEGKIPLQLQVEDLKKIIDEVLLLMRLQLSQYEARVNFTVTGNHFYAIADKLHIQGVLVNVIDNSLKYSGPRPDISITIAELEKDILISVADKGPGIPAAYLNKVFDKFFRVPVGNEHNIKGYGLGLSYAAGVMAQHGGSIEAQNITDGGCRFLLLFPKANA